MKDYLKYWVPVLVLLASFIGMGYGGYWTYVGIISFPILAIFDSLLPNDYSERNIKSAFFANIPVWICAVGPVLFYFLFAWQINHANLTTGEIIGGVLSLAWMGVIPLVPAAHELYHMRNKFPRIVGHYAHLCIFDCTRDIGHVVGHHIDVATPSDGDTAKRGLDLYTFTKQAVVDSTKFSFKMEGEALVKKGFTSFNIRHRAYRALLALIIFHSIIFMIGGWKAVIFSLIAQLISRCWVESFNYFQHYGLIRVPGTPIGRRHVWNHLGWFSRTVAFEITNHADHHLNSYLPFYKLKPHKESIVMPSVFVCFLSALIPSVWHNKIIKPALKRWDLEFATFEERALAKKQNEEAGWELWLDNFIEKSYSTMGI